MKGTWEVHITIVPAVCIHCHCTNGESSNFFKVSQCFLGPTRSHFVSHSHYSIRFSLFCSWACWQGRLSEEHPTVVPGWQCLKYSQTYRSPTSQARPVLSSEHRWGHCYFATVSHSALWPWKEKALLRPRLAQEVNFCSNSQPRRYLAIFLPPFK